VRFGVLFAFQVMPGQGVPLDQPYRDMLACVPVAEQLGYDSAFVASHHVQPDGWCPSPVVALSAAAAVTERIRLGTAILLLPLYAPMKLAEDIAVLDVLSQGRLVLGVAPGYVSEEFTAHGVPREQRFARFEEALDLLQEAFTQDQFSFEGRFFRVPSTRLEPRPLQRPHPPIWYGVSGPRSLRRAAARGCPVVASTRHDVPELKEHYAIHHEAATAHGFEIHDRPVSRVVFVAETRAEAERIAAPGVEYVFRELYAAKSAEGERPLRTDSGEVITDKRAGLFRELRSRFIIGDPDDAIREIHRLERDLAATELICWTHTPGVSGDDAMRSIRLFAEAVMPAFRSPAPA